MGTEIEHKYIVDNDSYREMSIGSHHIVQGYLSRDPMRTVRIRIKDKEAYITIKGKTHVDSRKEFEYRIPYTDAVELMELCIEPIIDKTRYLVEFGSNTWEVDEFHGRLAPLVMAEIELRNKSQTYARPPFVGKNVTGDVRYYNSNLRSYDELNGK